MGSPKFGRSENLRQSIHIPVLQKEVLQYLDPKPNENFIDCTIGEGGHTLAILEKNKPQGKVLGIEWDPEQIENCKLKAEFRDSGTKRKKRAKPSSHIKNFKERVILVCNNFVNLKEIVRQKNFQSVSGILFDLGLSSWHLEKSIRGFSFQKEEALDMRYNPQISLTAEKLVNSWPESDIERILKEYGQERFAKRIAKAIVISRKVKPIKSTFQLVEIIKRATPSWYWHQKIHFATRAFQALRIAVNDEIGNLQKALPQTLEILKPGGSLVVISFHSLEDRIVKNFFKENSKNGFLEIFTKKPTTPSKKEIEINPRSRSAKLRAAIKIKSI